MKKLQFAIIIGWIVLISIPAAGQVHTDSLKSVCFSDFNLFSDLSRGHELKNDSILSGSYFYDKLKWQEVFVPVTGTPGAASFILFDKTNSGKLLSDGFNQFSSYLVQPLRNFPSENSERRFSNVSYHLATRKEQHIFITHEQKIRPWLVAGLDFGALATPGEIARSKNSNRNFDIYFGFEAPSKLYRSFISYTANLVENEENGGISNDSLFENASSLNVRTLPINLAGATIKHRSRDYFLNQEFNLTRLIHPADSAQRAGKFESGSLVLNHSLWWKRKSSLFTSQDADSGYFENYFVDSTMTYDSSFFNDLYQVALLEYTTPENASGSAVKLGAGYEYQYTDYETGGADTIFKSGAAVFTAGYSASKFQADWYYSKTLNGDFSKGYRTCFDLIYTSDRSRDQLYLKLSAGKLEHTVKEVMYVSNHFLWINDFALLEQYDMNAGFTLSKFRLKLETRNRISKNLIFYREDCLPQSYGEYLIVSDLTLSNFLKFGKFGLDTKIVWSTSSNENVVPVPALALFSSIYFQDRFFKSVLGFKAGIDVSYFSAYYGYGFMPATGVFYVQQQKKIGNYPIAGFFVNLQIKSKATLFIRLDHFNAGINERTYYGAYHYPLPGRTIKFGVSWDLIN